MAILSPWTTWVQEINHRSSVMVASTSNHGALSLAIFAVAIIKMSSFLTGGMSYFVCPCEDTETT